MDKKDATTKRCASTTIWMTRREAVATGDVRKNFQDFSSYRIFSRMYGALNIDENKKIIAQFTCNL